MNEAKAKGFVKKAAVSMLVLTMVAVTGFAPSFSSYAMTAGNTNTEKAVNNSFPNATKKSGNGEKDKSETIYRTMTADGKTKETVVSEKLANVGKSDSITDFSSLTDIENTSGDEKFEQSGSTLNWAAKGSSITYQGKTNKELPINVKVTYYMDGNEMSASEIAGKSGKAEIHFDYSVTGTTSANGYSLKTPYTVASGVMLSNDDFQNISVTNGKTVNNGDSSVCLGIAFPGLSEDIGSGTAGLSIPESVVITADTTNFEIDGTYSVAMTGVLSDINTSGGDGIKGKINELESGLEQIGAASDKLLAGTNELAAGTKQLKDGTNTLSEGSSTLEQKSSLLSSKVTELDNQVQQISLPTIQLTDQQLTAIGQQAAGSSDVQGAAQQLSKGMNDTIYQSTYNAVESSVYQSVLNAITGGNPSTATDAQKAQAKTMSEQAATQAANNVKAQTETSVTNSVTTTVTKVAAGSAQSGAKGTAAEVNNQMAAFGTKINELKSGVAELDEATKKLSAGQSTLNSGVSKTNDSVTKLEKGAATLNSGMKTFNEQGIKKMISSLNSADIKGMVGRLEATVEASKNSSLIGGKTDAMSGESKIIFKTDEVKAK